MLDVTYSHVDVEKEFGVESLIHLVLFLIFYKFFLQKLFLAFSSF